MKHRVINSIPVIELYEKGKEKEMLPTMFFYHGWESRKERVLEYGYFMSAKGYRAILPEARGHGERQAQGQNGHNPLDFWDVVGSNVKEFPILVNKYVEEDKIIESQITVAGLSMGGITANALLTQYDWIYSAASLMGSPSPIDYSNWLLRRYRENGQLMMNLLDEKKVQQKLDELKPIALNLQPHKINNRPFYVWHGTADPTVPFIITDEFMKEIENEPYAKKLIYEVSEGIEHEVPADIIQNMVRFVHEASHI